MPGMEYVMLADGTCSGLLPNGDEEQFESEEEYEDAFYDACFELQNAFDAEWPEDWIA